MNPHSPYIVLEKGSTVNTPAALSAFMKNEPLSTRSATPHPAAEHRCAFSCASVLAGNDPTGLVPVLAGNDPTGLVPVLAGNDPTGLVPVVKKIEW